MIVLLGTLLSLSTLLVIFLMGTDRRVTGYWLGVPTQVAWCLYVLLVVYQPALLTLQAPLLAIYVRHLLASRRSRPTPVGPAPVPVAEVGTPPAEAERVRGPQPTSVPVAIGPDPLAATRERVLAPWGDLGLLD